MTCRPSDIHWRDALYNAVRQTPGGVSAAAAFLTVRRGRAITGESLRKKLRGLEGESVSLEIAELLTEWMQELVDGQPHATVWVQSLGAQFGLALDPVPAQPADGASGDLAVIQAKALLVSAHAGKLAGLLLDALDDNELDLAEGDALVAALRDIRLASHRMERNVRQRLARRRAHG